MGRLEIPADYETSFGIEQHRLPCEIFEGVPTFSLNCVNGLLSSKTFFLPLSFVIAILNISHNASWSPNAVTIAGGHGLGEALDQLHHPYGFYVEEDQTVLIADYENHRIVEWKPDATKGVLVAGGKGLGKRNDQLDKPTVVYVDKQTNTLIICDRGNKRVMRWSRRNGNRGEPLIENINCWGLAMDDQRFLYISDHDEHEVRRYKIGEKSGTVVAGGFGRGNNQNQLNQPSYLFVDANQSVYVSEPLNHRVTKWVKGNRTGIVVAGDRGQGKELKQLSFPCGLYVDQSGTVYVVDSWNDRVMRWSKEATNGTVIAGGKDRGNGTNQLYRADGLSFDQYGNLYVVDQWNNRVQRFALTKKQ